MKQKIKKLFKSRIFLCILTAIIVGTVSVSAATYFASSDVTYDNKTSGLSSTNVQGAIDELYNTCFPPTGGDSILDNTDIVTSGDGLYEDEYEEGKYTYKGANPNNYVTFNNEQAGWRIMSLNSDGTIKIMRYESIGNIAWDTTNSNNWARPATLNTYLNGTYYNSLTSEAQNQIVTATYNVGAVTDNNNDMKSQINDENSKTWYGKVALPTASEVIRTSSNKDQCGTITLYNKNHDKICKYTTWLTENGLWTISPNDADSNTIYYLHSFIAGIKPFTVGNTSTVTVYPVVTLSSEVKITGGDGSQNNPYEISL